MERFRETVTIPDGLRQHHRSARRIGGIVLIFGFVILALGIDRVRAKIDGLNNDVDELSRRIDSLTLAVASISDTQSEPKKPVRERLTVGATLPADVELRSVPSDWGPWSSRYRYVYSGEQIYLVEPSSRRIVRAID